MWDAYVVFNNRNGLLKPVIATNEQPVELADAAARRNATHEAISFAAYGLLRHRFTKGVGQKAVFALLEASMLRFGYDIALAGANETARDAPNEPVKAYRVGNRVAQAIIAFGLADNSCEATDYECPVGHPHHYTPKNRFPLNPYWNGPGAVEDPNRWQSLEIGQFIDQAGVAINGYPPFTGPQWGFVTPFALERGTHDKLDWAGHQRSDALPAQFDGVYFSPPPPPLWGANSTTDALYKGNFTTVLKVSAMLSPRDGVEVDTSPRNSAFGSNNLFAHNKCDLTPDEVCKSVGVGHAVNPVTGEPYAENVNLRGDYTRVLAEFWADGPQSETPPGHWNSILNDLFDHPAFEYRWGGAGAEMERLEYTVRAYLALNGALHDAAITAWGLKFKYDYVRPLTAVRFLASLGQSSNKSAPSYNAGGMPIVEGHTLVLTLPDVCVDNCELETGFTPGPMYRLGRDNIGKVMGRAWDSLSFHCEGVCWYPAQDWKTYQRPSFVTPPFAGFVSGHSTFSRAAADTITAFTGSQYFPGGMGRFVALGGFEAIANGTDFLVFEQGPSRSVELQWATYGDASDECSLSRIYGGIHPPADDIPGRMIGRQVALNVWAKLTKDVFGPVTGTRAAVRLTFDDASVLPRRFGGEKAAMLWARRVALAAHESVVAPGDETFVGVTARLLPRQANEGAHERTVLLLGGHPDAGAAMVREFSRDPDVRRAVPAECNAVSCEVTSEHHGNGTTVLGGGTIALIVLAILCFVVIVVLAVGTTLRKRAQAEAK
jgi:hypothetical protein